MADNQMLPLSSAPFAHCAGFTVQCTAIAPSRDQESHCGQAHTVLPSHHALHSQEDVPG